MRTPHPCCALDPFFPNRGQIWHASVGPWCTLPCQNLYRDQLILLYYSHTQLSNFKFSAAVVFVTVIRRLLQDFYGRFAVQLGSCSQIGRLTVNRLVILFSTVQVSFLQYQLFIALIDMTYHFSINLCPSLFNIYGRLVRCNVSTDPVPGPTQYTNRIRFQYQFMHFPRQIKQQ